MICLVSFVLNYAFYFFTDYKMAKLFGCVCFREKEEEISVLDYRHCSLKEVPKDIFNYERTLEELFVDANQIKELPRVSGIVDLVQ